MPQVYDFGLRVYVPDMWTAWAHVDIRNQPYPFQEPLYFRVPIQNRIDLFVDDGKLDAGIAPEMDFSRAIVGESAYQRRVLSEQKRRVLEVFQAKASPLVKQIIANPGCLGRRHSVTFRVEDREECSCVSDCVRVFRRKQGPTRYKGIGEE